MSTFKCRVFFATLGGMENYIFANDTWKDRLLKRFVKYTAIWSESDGNKADEGVFPSTERQWDFARELEKELKSLGMDQVVLTENCYVYGRMKASCGNGGTAASTDKGTSTKKESICFLAHMDTVDEVSGKNVKAKITKNEEGDTIITSDGTTLLGADDKAGVAEIMTALEYFKENPEIPHGEIEVLFSPDEETGHGMDKVPLELLKSKKAYTLDGGHIGEVEIECFNAWAAHIEFTGKATHTGDAKKSGMINANLMLANFLNQLPSTMRPETTEDREGFIAVMETSGSIASASCELLLRSFNMEEINREKEIIKNACADVEKTFGGIIDLTFKEQYQNMHDKIKESGSDVVDCLIAACKDCGVEPVFKPIRGGTDGSRLTEMGIPTPNIWTGGHNFHSKNEWASLNQMAKATDVVIRLNV